MTTSKPTIDLRPEQIALLRHEQTVEAAEADLRAGRAVDRKALLASAAIASGAALAAADKLSQPALAKLAEMNDAAALLPAEKFVSALAEVAAVSHLVYFWAAEKAGAVLLAAHQVQGGEPKKEPPAYIADMARGVATFLGI